MAHRLPLRMILLTYWALAGSLASAQGVEPEKGDLTTTSSILRLLEIAAGTPAEVGGGQAIGQQGQAAVAPGFAVVAAPASPARPREFQLGWQMSSKSTKPVVSAGMRFSFRAPGNGAAGPESWSGNAAGPASALARADPGAPGAGAAPREPLVFGAYSRSLDIGEDARLIPFAEVTAGAENLVRVGADVLIRDVDLLAPMREAGWFGQGASASATGLSLVVGGDWAAVASETARIGEIGGSLLGRQRLRTGLHWQGRRSDAFYGLSWQQNLGLAGARAENHLVGALQVNFSF